MEAGYLITNRNGIFRLQCYGNEQLALETMAIHKSKGLDVVAVTEEELYRFFKEKEAV